MTSTSQNEDLRAAWFGKVSPNWKLARAKNAFQVVSKKVGQRSSEYDLLSLTLRGIIPRDIESGKGKFPESFDTYQEVKESDIVFCLFDIDETPRTVGLSNIDGMITGAYTVVRCTKYAEPRFVTYFYRSIDERKGLRPFYTGLRKVVRTETFLNAAFPLPDLSTQRAIADFLDRETARIESLIEKKERLVELLGEKWEAKVQSAVSGAGAANNKTCSNQFFSKVPKDWRLQSLKSVCNLISGYAFKSEFFQREQTDLPVLVTPGSFNPDGGLYPARESAIGYSGEFEKRFVLEKGDMVVAMTDLSYRKLILGRCEFVAEDGMLLNQRIAKIINLDPEVRPAFLRYAMNARSCREQVALSATGATVFHSSADKIRSTYILVPPPEVQIRIVAELDRYDRFNQETEKKLNSSNDRLKEYRSALITSAVTGQIDVSTYAKSGTTDRQLDAIQAEMN